ncbi:replication initiation factor domain-containing protein [Acinetobacter ursingii]|uniref:replication initiation factor domain-containing protein n=1 Tax=Acinetobacter ursingii TaxID=108980 RepID=UPI003AF462EE
MYADRPKITRIDYAYDDLEGAIVSPDWADLQDTLGGFQMGGRPPSFQTAGNWKRPDGSGRTAYIGKRESSKYCRIYEKGKQLGDKDSLWTRVEVFMGQTQNLEFSYQPLCQFMSMIRPFVIAIAYLIGAYILMGLSRGSSE